MLVKPLTFCVDKTGIKYPPCKSVFIPVMLEQKENERFKEEEQIAKSAQNNLNALTNLRNKCGERINYMTSMEGRSIYSNEMKNLLKQYQGFLTEIDKQSKVEERKIFEFNQLKSLRAE